MVVADAVFTRDTIALSPLFALSPLIACVVLPPLRTALFAVAAVLAAGISGFWHHDLDSAQHLVRELDVFLVSSAAVMVSVTRIRQAQRLGRFVKLAEVAQRAVLPVVPAHVRHTDIAVRYESATEDTVIGGDLYDCYHSISHTRFLIGDVRGKGIGAVEQAGRVIRAFRQAAAIHTDLDEVAEEMSAYLAPFFDEEEFVTAILLDTTVPSRPLLVNAGHPAPLLVRLDGTYEFLETDADLPLGLGQDFSQWEFDWKPGDRLLLFTDGVSEARDADGEFLPLRDLVPVLRGQSVETTLDLVLARVRDHSVRGELGDDVAVMLLEHTTAIKEVRPRTREQDWLPLLPN
ncbi:PP2C family protein-serine/threonine phosphatase [Nocardioides gilvus]|uniref:PP2C family protein-serine/threonine phosphatase n=1 Tax=Nocardioides gilvus TaxID=1735589 RepID=UPI000D740751|nr:PP2C family protein-serine/threonine phosphatase [Nocardioides gilvus]